MPRKARAATDDDLAAAKNIGDRIKDIRLAMEMSPSEFGAAGGVSQAQQYRIEAGERVPDAMYLLKIGVEFKIDVHALLFGSNQLTAEELALLDNFRASDQEGRRKLRQEGTPATKHVKYLKGRKAA